MGRNGDGTGDGVSAYRRAHGLLSLAECSAMLSGLPALGKRARVTSALEFIATRCEDLAARTTCLRMLRDGFCPTSSVDHGDLCDVLSRFGIMRIMGSSEIGTCVLVVPGRDNARRASSYLARREEGTCR